jgi:hypothetical protein
MTGGARHHGPKSQRASGQGPIRDSLLKADAVQRPEMLIRMALLRGAAFDEDMNRMAIATARGAAVVATVAATVSTTTAVTNMEERPHFSSFMNPMHYSLRANRADLRGPAAAVPETTDAPFFVALLLLQCCLHVLLGRPRSRKYADHDRRIQLGLNETPFELDYGSLYRKDTAHMLATRYLDLRFLQVFRMKAAFGRA